MQTMPSSVSSASTTGQNGPGAPVSGAIDITQAKLDLLDKVLNQGVTGELNNRAMTSVRRCIVNSVLKVF